MIRRMCVVGIWSLLATTVAATDVVAQQEGEATLAELLELPEAWAQGSVAEQQVFGWASRLGNPDQWGVEAPLPVLSQCSVADYRERVQPGWAFQSPEVAAESVAILSESCACGDGQACHVLVSSALGAGLGIAPALNRACDAAGGTGLSCVVQTLHAMQFQQAEQPPAMGTTPEQVAFWCATAGVAPVCTAILDVALGSVPRRFASGYMNRACVAGDMVACMRHGGVNDPEERSELRQSMDRGCEDGQTSACSAAALIRLAELNGAAPSEALLSNIVAGRSLESIRAAACADREEVGCRALSNRLLEASVTQPPQGGQAPWPATAERYCEVEQNQSCITLAAARFSACLRYAFCPNSERDALNSLLGTVPEMAAMRTFDLALGLFGPVDMSQAVAFGMERCASGDSRSCTATASLIARSVPPQNIAIEHVRTAAQACDLGMVEACEWLAVNHGGNTQLGELAVQQGCALGNSLLCAVSATFTYRGREPDDALWSELTTQCEQGDALICSALVLHLIAGETSISLERVVTAAERVCLAGEPAGCWALGELVGRGIALPMTADGAPQATALLTACEHGTNEACRQVVRIMLAMDEPSDLGLDASAVSSAVAASGLPGASTLRFHVLAPSEREASVALIRELYIACHGDESGNDAHACAQLHDEYDNLSRVADEMPWPPGPAVYYRQRACLAELELCTEPWW